MISWVDPIRIARAMRRSACLCAVPLGLAFPVAVPAHAIVVESIPAHDARLETPPPRILLRFNTKVEHDLCRVRLEGPNGFIQTKLDPPEAPERLEARLPTLAPGTYLLRYQTFSPDGHVTAGVLRFHVGTDAGEP